jgi:hypothetical protein
VAIVLAVLVVVAAAAVMVLFFPEASVRWLVGGGSSKAAPAKVAETPTTVPSGAERSAPPTPETAAKPAAPTPGGPAPSGPAEAQAAATPTAEPDVEPPPAPEPATAPALRAQGPAPNPPPVREPAPARTTPRPAAAAAPPATGTFHKVLNIISEPHGNELQVTIFLDGRVEEWQYSVARLESPPRELVRIQGVEQPFPRSELVVSSDLAERIRVGFHPERRTSELHVVVDLANPGVVLDRSEAAGKEIRLFFSRGES